MADAHYVDCRLLAHKGECGLWHYTVEAVAEGGDVVGTGHAVYFDRYTYFEWPEGLIDAADSVSDDVYDRAQALVQSCWVGNDPFFEGETFTYLLFPYHFRVDEAYRGQALSYRMMRFLLDLPTSDYTLTVIAPGPLHTSIKGDSDEAISKLQKHWLEFGFRPLPAQVAGLQLFGHSTISVFPKGSWAAKADWLEAS
jgi:hypothetical protein